MFTFHPAPSRLPSTRRQFAPTINPSSYYWPQYVASRPLAVRTSQTPLLAAPSAPLVFASPSRGRATMTPAIRFALRNSLNSCSTTKPRLRAAALPPSVHILRESDEQRVRVRHSERVPC